jgi:ribonuclease D
MSEYELVDLATDRSLQSLLADEERIGVDTEFMREKTFFSQLCLVQVAARKTFVCADPLTLDAADDARRDDVWQTITRPAWVLHSGRQDIEVVYQSCGRMPSSLFDTQIAAALLGYQPQIGYAGLVKELFGVELEKSHTRADWSKRPLSDAVLKYATEDVEYLLPAADLLTERLTELGRISWASEDSADLLDIDLYDLDPEGSVSRLKAASNLQGRARALAVKIAAWREHEAIRSNRPRQWIMRDAVLIGIAVSGPENRDQLAGIDGMPESTVRRAGDQLLSIVAATTHDETSYKPPARPNEKQKTLLKAMQQLVSAQAKSLSIATEIVAPKKELSAAMLGVRNSRVFRGWRLESVGQALLELLEND